MDFHLSDRGVLTITVPPEVELVACLKISIKGNPVGVESASSRLPKQKRTPISMPRPSKPFMTTDAHMLRGMMIAAFSISSAVHMMVRTVSPRALKTDLGGGNRNRDVSAYPYGWQHQYLRYI